MFSYSQSIGRPGTSLPTLYYLSNVYALKLLVPTSTNTKKLIISHWCYFQFELILPHGTMVLKCTPNRRNAELSIKKEKTRKILEDNLKNMIDGSNMVVMKKCTEIWAVYDEMQDELKSSMTIIGQWIWNMEW